MTDYSDLVQRLRNHDYLNDYFFGEWGFDAADAIEAQAKRIEELEAQNEKWGKVGLHYQAEWNIAIVRIEELEHQLKVECDTYLWKRKLMSRRIASLQGWMKKLFQYGSSPEARRNEMTMTTEIPDYLMREGEDLLLETSDLEKEE